MRIAVAGKGESGKTTISATTSRLFAKRGYVVNAVDDDPNPNLAASLGLAEDDIDRLSRVASEEILEEYEDDNSHAVMTLTQPFDQAIRDYGVIGPDGPWVLAMIGLLGAGKR